MQELTRADQVYVCLWSHGAWAAGHIHFVVQPAWNAWRDRFAAPGPSVQVAMFISNTAPPTVEIEAFCARAREWFAGGDN